MHCDDFDMLKFEIKFITNIMKNLTFLGSKCNDKFSVTFQKWHKYQVDDSAERVAKYREKVTVQEKEKEIRVKNKNKEKDKEGITTLAQSDKITFDWNRFKFMNLNGKTEIFQEKYPAINVTQELLSMEAWLMANPKNRKSNYERFITNWLRRTQDKAKTIPVEESRDAKIKREADGMRERMRRKESDENY